MELAKGGTRERGGPMPMPPGGFRNKGTGWRVIVKGLPMSASWQDLKVRGWACWLRPFLTLAFSILQYHHPMHSHSALLSITQGHFRKVVNPSLITCFFPPRPETYD